MEQTKSMCVLFVLATGLVLAQPATLPKTDAPPVQTAPADTDAPKPEAKSDTNAPDTTKLPATDPAAAATIKAPAQSSMVPAPIPGSAADQMRASIQKQRAAVRQQAQTAGAWLVPWSDEPAIAGPPPCDAIEDEISGPLIASAAKANQIEVPLLHAVIAQESGFRPCAVSAKGAQGLMQLMPDTAGSLGVTDAFDPRQSIEAGARYLKQLIDKYKGDLKLALGAYNAGPAAIDAAGAIPDIQETRDYVDSILKKIK